MFTARIPMASGSRSSSATPVPAVGHGCHSLPGKILRFGAFCALLALVSPRTAEAQTLGTLQVSARVVPASAAWTGVSEANLAARQAIGARAAGALVRENGVVLTRAELLPSGDRRVLLVTVQHPRN